jgi:hypothetical protein
MLSFFVIFFVEQHSCVDVGRKICYMFIFSELKRVEEGLFCIFDGDGVCSQGERNGFRPPARIIIARSLNLK